MRNLEAVDLKVQSRSYKSIRFGVVRAFASTTGKLEQDISDDDELPADRLGFFARLNRYHRVLMIDVMGAKTVGELVCIIELKRAVPHALSLS